MKRRHPLVLIATLLLVAGLAACSNEDRHEHDHEHSGAHTHEGEESGDELALDQTYDKIRHGARLILAYDPEAKAFVGTVENTTNRNLERVRVEVHLSNGRELGPTTPTDLEPGQKTTVKLVPTSRDFERWTAHPEVGSAEHSHGEGGEHRHGEGSEHGGEHRREGKGEHR